MEIEKHITENGDLKLSVNFKDKTDQKELIKLIKKDYLEFLSEIHEEIYRETDLRFLFDTEKIHLGDLFGGDILTDLHYKNKENVREFTADQWNKRSWYYPRYQIEGWEEVLVENGSVILKARGN